VVIKAGQTGPAIQLLRSEDKVASATTSARPRSKRQRGDRDHRDAESVPRRDGQADTVPRLRVPPLLV
jgi:hypothetical protein